MSGRPATHMNYRVQQMYSYEYRSSSNGGLWLHCDPRPPPPTPLSPVSALPNNPFIIATLNRWFDGRDEPLRTNALLHTLRISPADVFCLQEMTAGCLSRIKADPDVQSKWIISNCDGIFGVSYGSATWYGQLTLVRKQTASVLGVRDVYLSFQGKELRPLHIVDIEIKNGARRLQVINVHLQSLEKEGMERWEQVKLAALLADQVHPKMTILAGDTNFYTKEGMDTATLAGFIDLWKVLHASEPGYTFGLTYPSSTAPLPKRIDGVFQWPTSFMTPSQISKFGEECLQESPRAFLSDHIGLVATFTQNLH